MANKPKNIKELRARKAEIKRKLDQGFESPLDNVKGILKGYTNGDQSPLALFDKTEDGRNQLMDEGVKAALTIVASAAVSRFKLGPVPKFLLTAGVAIATPIIVDKIQAAVTKKIDKKLSELDT